MAEFMDYHPEKDLRDGLDARRADGPNRQTTILLSRRPRQDREWDRFVAAGIMPAVDRWTARLDAVFLPARLRSTKSDCAPRSSIPVLLERGEPGKTQGAIIVESQQLRVLAGAQGSAMRPGDAPPIDTDAATVQPRQQTPEVPRPKDRMVVPAVPSMSAWIWTS
ncbi:uncharacterized protein EURHEDRAFT_380404 [Aspergillus ruber CBS 135680]|uniref:Uncharacterized protein n=1 Tax=Aspergillus ruber (strain CBS 135680) TaxID=1388766 RepID=A0A017S613_ASPRC|nr:uncharacterized protein EURHEDRAFT_380404 [Aspergillus ruber CBS 135680]EYE92034.1 hypothetical protein EURHEDRAFT_380404 [Aspergillus ruber CBS 135680]